MLCNTFNEVLVRDRFAGYQSFEFREPVVHELQLGHVRVFEGLAGPHQLHQIRPLEERGASAPLSCSCKGSYKRAVTPKKP